MLLKVVGGRVRSVGRDVIERRRLRSRVGRNGTGGERGSEAEGGREGVTLSL